MPGERTDVHVRFDAPVARYVMRRAWHASQGFVIAKDASVHMRLRVNGTNELRNLLLSYGEFMQVLAPQSLREEIERIGSAMARNHAGDAPDVSDFDWSKAKP
jgi:predicted DNA-binding transcriptional regulator YafY